MVFQTFGLLPWLDVTENITLGLEARGVSLKERLKKLLNILIWLVWKVLKRHIQESFLGE